MIESFELIGTLVLLKADNLDVDDTVVKFVTSFAQTMMVTEVSIRL
jgi:hypothetical protein